jgi:hypothetical protein
MIRRLGMRTITREDRAAVASLVASPPTAAHVGRWAQLLTADEVQEFEAVAGDLLAELGY